LIKLFGCEGGGGKGEDEEWDEERSAQGAWLVFV